MKERILIISDEFSLSHNFRADLCELLSLFYYNKYDFKNIYLLFPVTEPKEFINENKDFYYRKRLFNFLYKKGANLYESNHKNLEKILDDIKNEKNKEINFLNFIFTHGSLEKNNVGIIYTALYDKEILESERLFGLVSSLNCNSYFFYFPQCYSRNFSRPFQELKNTITISISKENKTAAAHSFNYLFFRNLRKGRNLLDDKNYLKNNFFRIYKGFLPNKHLPLLEREYKENHNLSEHLSVKDAFEFSLFLDKEIYCNDWNKGSTPYQYEESPILFSNNIDPEVYYI